MDGPWYTWWWLWVLVAAACAGIGYLKIRILKAWSEKRKQAGKALSEDDDVL